MTAPDDTSEPALASEPRGAALTRLAAMAAFLIVGLAYASFLIRVPTLKIEHGLSEGQLGLLLFVPSVCALISMQVTGALVARFGSAPIARVTGVLLPLSLLGIALAADPIQLAVALAVFGLIDGLLDVSMNAHAIAVERTLKRAIMNRCHAAWSIGALAASLLGGLALQAGFSLTAHFAWMGVGVALLALVAGFWMLPPAADRQQTQEKKIRLQWRAGWTPRVLLLGAMGASVLVLEGAVGNWSGVLLLDERGATLAVASLGYTLFNICQVGGRLVGDRLHEKYGAPLLVRVSGAIAIAGLVLVVASPNAAVTIAGFGVVGAGLSVLLPLIFSAVGHGSDVGAATALARFTTMTYSGLLFGPVLIGWLAEAVGLVTVFVGLLLLLLVVIVNARATGSADLRES